MSTTLLAPLVVYGDEGYLATRFSVNLPVQAPGMVLHADTPYLIQLSEPLDKRNVVQIYTADRTELVAEFMAVSVERQEPVDETLFTFIETDLSAPLPMKQWFYPGRRHGLEFVYPKEQALEIARHAQGPVLSADAGDLRDLSNILVETIAPSKTEVPVQTVAASANNGPSEPPSAADPVVNQEVRELPRTASELSLIALVGALCLGAGLGMKVLAARM
jgi:hypothetical protein